MFGNIGFTEILILFFIFLLLFGAKRLPEIGASVGKGIREFQRSLKEVKDSVESPSVSASAPPEGRQLDAPPQPSATTGDPKRLSQ